MPYKGSHRKKNRTHVRDNPQTAKEKPPRSMIVKRGRVDPAVSQLIRDMRDIMEPLTFRRLKARKSNTVKDFVSVSGMLGATHLMMLSQSAGGVALRVARMPHGPTLYFRVVRYSLAHDVIASQRNPADVAAAYEHAPLVVLNGFGGVAEDGAAGAPKHVQLQATTFQNMFPAMNISNMRLKDCRRVVLFHYRKEADEVDVRHFSVRAQPTGISRAVRKLTKSKVPDLGHLQDISDFVVGPTAGASRRRSKAGAAAAGGGGRGGGRGGSSAGDLDGYATSDSEFEDESAQVTLSQSYVGRGNMKSGQSAIKLSEIGPRLSLRLIRVEKGVCDGEVLYHAFVKKTAAEAEELRRVHREREALKKARRAEQDANVKRKKAAKEAKKEARLERQRLRREAIARGEIADDGKEEEEEDDEEEVEEEEEEENEEEDVEGGGGGYEAGGEVDGAENDEEEGSEGGEEGVEGDGDEEDDGSEISFGSEAEEESEEEDGDGNEEDEEEEGEEAGAIKRKRGDDESGDEEDDDDDEEEAEDDDEEDDDEEDDDDDDDEEEEEVPAPKKGGKAAPSTSTSAAPPTAKRARA